MSIVTHFVSGCVTTLGMYPVYSLFPYSYRRLLRRVHPHLTKVVVDTEREKEAKKTIVHALRRKKVFDLLSISIPKSKMWRWKLHPNNRLDDISHFARPLYVLASNEGLHSLNIAHTIKNGEKLNTKDLVKYIVVVLEKTKNRSIMIDGTLTRIDDEVDTIRINFHRTFIKSYYEVYIETTCKSSIIQIDEFLNSQPRKELLEHIRKFDNDRESYLKSYRGVTLDMFKGSTLIKRVELPLNVYNVQNDLILILQHIKVQ